MTIPRNVKLVGKRFERRRRSARQKHAIVDCELVNRIGRAGIRHRALEEVWNLPVPVERRSQVAAAPIEFADGVATVTVQTTSPGRLSPGMHGMHIHAVGKCEANSVAPTGGAPGDFLSAGGHFQGAGAPGHPGHGGDLSSLQVRPDGSALLVTTTYRLVTSASERFVMVRALALEPETLPASL